jgi:hypothetical protein
VNIEMIEDPAADPNNILWFSGDQLRFGDRGLAMRARETDLPQSGQTDEPEALPKGADGTSFADTAGDDPGAPNFVLFFNGASDDPFS